MLPKKILVIQTAFIGDVILATSVVEKLHLHFPTASIDMLVRKGNESLLAGHPFLRSVKVWNKRESKWKHLFQMLSGIRAEKYDLVVNLQRFASSGVLTAFSGAKHTVGFDKNPLSFLFTKKVPHLIGSMDQPSDHEVKRCLRTIDHIVGTDFVSPRLYPSAKDKEVVKPLIGESFITISPASVWFTKQTPLAVWSDFLQKIPDQKVYVLGGPGDQAIANELIALSGHTHIISLAGKLSLLQSAELMTHAEMNYTNDSGPLHLCSATKAPVTAVFCSTIPEFGFGPIHSNGKVVQTNERLSCRPCGLHGFKACPKGHFKCGEIEIDALIQQLPS